MVPLFKCSVFRSPRYFVFSFSFESSDAESDVLLSAEQEARRSPLTHAQVTLFDKSMAMKHRRYIERNIDIDSDDDAASEEEDINDTDFIELYRGHIKRKKMRKKIRANPDVRIKPRIVTISFPGVQILRTLVPGLQVEILLAETIAQWETE